MYRDFSNSAKQKLLDQVAQVENERKSSIEECFGSKWYVFQSWADVLNIKRYFNNVLMYHQKVFEKNTATKSSINKLFFYVGRVDKSMKSKLSKKHEKVHSITELVEELSKIVNPANGQFNMDEANSFLSALLKKIDENKDLSDYFYIDENNKKHYDWEKIHHLLTKDTEDLTDQEKTILFTLLGTFVDKENECINAEDLERFVSAGYTTPSEVTADNYHISFYYLPNGQQQQYYYLQNKSFMTDTMKYLLETCLNGDKVEDNNNGIDEYNVVETNLLPVLKAVYGNYQVIEWRAMYPNVYTARKTFDDKTMNEFNSACVPKISIKYSPNCDGTIDRYEINSSAFNRGNVYATEEIRNKQGYVVGYHYVEEDDYSDCTIQVYVNCNNTAPVSAVDLKDRTILNTFREEFDQTKAIADTVMEFAEYIPIVGKLISGGYKLYTAKDALDKASAITKSAKSADLDAFGVSKKTETGVDAGLKGVDAVLGLYTKYVASEKNKAKVNNAIDVSQGLANSIKAKMYYGLAFDTMIVKYDHVTTYDNNGRKSIEVETNCDKLECTISFDGWHPDYDTFHGAAYNEFCKQEANPARGISAEDVFDDLWRDAQDYLETGNESELLKKYLATVNWESLKSE